MTYTDTPTTLRSNQNPKDILMVLAIIASIIGFFSVLFTS